MTNYVAYLNVKKMSEIISYYPSSDTTRAIKKATYPMYEHLAGLKFKPLQ